MPIDRSILSSIGFVYNIKQQASNLCGKSPIDPPCMIATSYMQPFFTNDDIRHDCGLFKNISDIILMPIRGFIPNIIEDHPNT